MWRGGSTPTRVAPTLPGRMRAMTRSEPTRRDAGPVGVGRAAAVAAPALDTHVVALFAGLLLLVLLIL